MSSEGHTVLSQEEYATACIPENDEETDVSTPGSSDVEGEKTEREKCDRKISVINTIIRQKENSLKSFVLKQPSRDYYSRERDRLHNDIKVTKESRNCEFLKTKRIGEELGETNVAVQQKTEDIRKIQSNLPYKNEKKIDAAIMRLQREVKKPEKAPEEKEIHQEIDKLKRSKDNLEAYKDLKTEIDALKEKQKTLRIRRDEHYVKLASIKQEEDCIKGSLTKLRMEEDLEWNKYRTAQGVREGLKKEIDDLYKNRKAVVSMLKKEITFQKRVKECRRRSKPVLIPHAVKYMSAKAQHEEKKVPYSEEINACNMLISYLEKSFPIHNSLENEKPVSFRDDGLHYDSGDKDETDHLRGLYYGIRKRPSKREKRQKKYQTAPELMRKCVHHPNVLSQFVFVDVPPPVAVADICVSIKQLEKKRDLFHDQQKAVDEFASNLITRRKSLELMGDTVIPSSRRSEYLDIPKDKPVVTEWIHSSFESPDESERGTTSVHGSIDNKSSERWKDESSESNNGVENGEETKKEKSCENIDPGDTNMIGNKTGRAKVQFSVGEIDEHGYVEFEDFYPRYVDDKLLTPLNAVSVHGRSKSLDSFGALHNEKTLPLTCRRARSISEKLCFHSDNFTELRAVRSEL